MSFGVAYQVRDAFFTSWTVFIETGSCEQRIPRNVHYFIFFTSRRNSLRVWNTSNSWYLRSNKRIHLEENINM